MTVAISTVLMLSLLAAPMFAGAQSGPSLADQLFDDIADRQLDDFSHIEAAFILSDVTSRDSLDYYVRWYEDLVQRIRDFHFDSIDRMGSANKVFNYIRTTLYEEYEREATTMLDIVNDKRYNCVSSTILYNMVCRDMSWPTQAFETPTHVYTIFTEFDQKVIVENTHPMGFNIMQNLDTYSRYLSQFYPENQVYRIGLDQLYAHENSRGRVISNTELLGLLAYNQAYFAMQEEDYERAYDMVLVAQDFNQDSRSNVKLELNLYNRWGQQCFEEERFYDAFQVLADGAYRYPKNKGLVRNARTALLNTLRQNWQERKWRQSHQALSEAGELSLITSEQDRERVRTILMNWANYLGRQGSRADAIQVWQHLEAFQK